MKLSTLGMKSSGPKLLVTPLHEDWLKTNADLHYSGAALEFAAQELGATGRDRRGGFSASALGSCARSQQFTFLGMPTNSLRPRQHQVAHNGNFVHLRWQMAGITAGWLARPEVPMPENEWGLSGTLDGVLQGGEGLEIKSANERAYSSALSFGVKDEHMFQVHSYMLGMLIDVFSVIYENKNTQDWVEYVVERDEGWIKKVKDACDQRWEGVAKRELEPRLDKCEYREGWQYDWCKYRDVCMATRSWPR